MDKIEEIFKPIDGFDKYFVSNMGNVKSDKTNRLLKVQKKIGYSTVGLSIINKRYCFLIHRLVAKAFIPNPENKPDVTKQIAQMQETREKIVQDQIKQQNDYNSLINKLTNVNPQMAQDKIDKLTFIVQELSMENNQLKEKVKYLEDKLKSLIIEQIQFKRNSTAHQN